jgi:hypothetical protein
LITDRVGTTHVIRTATTALRHLRWCFVLFALLSHPAWSAVPEYDVKAVLLFKISKFVRWPEAAFATSGGTLRVCIVGRDDFGESIDNLKGLKVQGQVVDIERLPLPEQSPSGCHVVFISRSERGRLPSLLNALAGTSVLTVSDIEGFAVQGGMVGFATSDGKISFQINPAASARAGLEIGAQLLQLAMLVNEQRAEVRP